jgi:uncharacterized protein
VRELTLESVRVSMQSYQRGLILREKDSERFLLIWIGSPEAEAIVLRLQDVKASRPQTHDLIRNLIEQFGARVQHVLLNDLREGTYYAQIVLDVSGETVEVDSRPSDAIALAVRASAPIYAEEAVLDEAAIQLQDEGEGGGERAESQPVDPAELERLGAFKDFIEGLDLSDFDERKG